MKALVRYTATVVLVLLWGGASVFGQAQTIQVAQDGEVTSLTEAMELAADGDTIRVQGGTYRESPIEVNKSVVLIGEDRPVIDGEQEHEILRVNADDVEIHGFHFANAPSSHIRDNAAVRYNRVQGGVIADNTFDDNFFAIYLARSDWVIIKDNEIQAYGDREATSANGIHLWNSSHAAIVGNTVRGHRDGIYLEYVENSYIEDNLVEENIRYGLHFMFSDDCRYSENVFRDNGAGVAVMYSSGVDMDNNRFDDNWGSSSYGMLLKEMTDGKIRNNHFTGNTTGIRVEGTSRMDVRENHFSGNGWAISIMANSQDNLFTRNNFIDNTFDVATNSRQNFSEFNRNYWSSYNGYDLTGDGIGDVPYRPVRLFSLIVERDSIAMILLRSIFVELLDMAERVMPVLTPETLVDHEPSMQEFSI